MDIDNFSGTYAFLSNFYKSPVTFNGITAPTVEHMYQAAKTVDNSDAQFILESTTPAVAKRRGKTIKMVENWDEVKFGVMLTLVRLKFAQNPILAEKLIDTGDAKLIEGNWWHDVYWGVCNGKGENNLGKILMKVREEIYNGN